MKSIAYVPSDLSETLTSIGKEGSPATETKTGSFPKVQRSPEGRKVVRVSSTGNPTIGYSNPLKTLLLGSGCTVGLTMKGDP